MATYKKYTEQYCKMKKVKHCFMHNIETTKNYHINKIFILLNISLSVKKIKQK